MAITLADVFSWESFGNQLLSGYNNLQMPSSDNASIIVDLIHYHAASDPLIFAIRASLFVAFFCWFLSMATGSHSWVDRLWSIVPALYAVHFSVRDMFYWPKDTPFPHQPRVYLATFFIVLWGIRLTYNFYRKGGYAFDSEDYRWPYLGSKIPAGAWLIFNIVFISLYQNLLLVAITIPLYTAWKASLIEAMPLNWIDALATLLFLSALTLETIADQQQWEFQEAKKKAINNKEVLSGDFKRGFLTNGLFKYSRHPNFIGEMSIWWSVYLFSVAAGYPTYNAWFNPSIIGVLNLTLLFQGSTMLTEYLTSQKYPAYKQYQKTTSRFIPLPAGESLDDLEQKSK